jgi:hypothetical protein
MSSIFLKTCIHNFYCVTFDFSKCFWVNVGNSLFSVVSLPPCFVDYSNEIFLCEISTKRILAMEGLQIVVAKITHNPLCWGSLLRDRANVSSALRSVPSARRRTCSLSPALPVSRNVVTSRCIVGYTLLNASRKSPNDLMRSNDPEWTHVMPLHSLCETCVSSGLATRVPFTRVSEGWERLLHGG